MIRRDEPIHWRVQGFRRYRPENPISRGMVAAAPWVNVGLLVVAYLYLLLPNVMQPGLIVRLPTSPLQSGTRYGLDVVVLSLEIPGTAGRQEIVYFDDERFLIGQPAQREVLARRFEKAARDRPNAPMVIEADKAVQHGTVIDLFNLAASAGIGEVNVATMAPR